MKRALAALMLIAAVAPLPGAAHRCGVPACQRRLGERRTDPVGRQRAGRGPGRIGRYLPELQVYEPAFLFAADSSGWRMASDSLLAVHQQRWKWDLAWRNVPHLRRHVLRAAPGSTDSRGKAGQALVQSRGRLGAGHHGAAAAGALRCAQSPGSRPRGRGAGARGHEGRNRVPDLRGRVRLRDAGAVLGRRVGIPTGARLDPGLAFAPCAWGSSSPVPATSSAPSSG